MEDAGPVRKNGFELPFHPFQMLSWVVFGSDCACFCVFALPLVGTLPMQVCVGSCFACSVFVLVFFTVKTTRCNPADPNVGKQQSDFADVDTDMMPYCTTCNVPVSERCKHCCACNKCVDVFDHHCHWLNNCIGAANYKSYLVVITSCAIMIGIVLGTFVYLLLESFLNEDAFGERVQKVQYIRNVPKVALSVILIALTLINGPLFVFDLQLVVMHAFLASQNLTTYEYIMKKRSMDEESEENEVCEGDKEESSKAGKPTRSRIRTLPSCLDWIVFARCGKRRRRKRTDSIQRIATPNADVVVCGEPCDERKGEHNLATIADGTPSPPGFTTEATRTDSEVTASFGKSVVDDQEVSPEKCVKTHAFSEQQQEEPTLVSPFEQSLTDDQEDQRAVHQGTMVAEGRSPVHESEVVRPTLTCSCEPTIEK